MKTCNGCVYVTSIKKTDYATRYSAIHDAQVTLRVDTYVTACGYSSGNPQEIPTDRKPCSSFREDK